jgi:PAS domain S-box-containing protein
LPTLPKITCTAMTDRARDDNEPHLPSSTWRQIVDGAVETAIISTDLAGCVTSWNEGARRIFGWSEAEMLGKRLDLIFVEADRAAGILAEEIADALAKGRGGGEEGWRLRKDGSRFWAVGELAPIRDASAQALGFVKIVRDRTAQRRAEEELAEERRALEILNRAGSALALESDLHRLVQIVTDAGVELSGAGFGAFFYNVLDDAGESYMLYTLSGVPREAFESFPMPRNTAVFGPTFSGAGIVRSDDITQDPRYGQNAPRRGMPEGHLPVRSYLAVPVVSRRGGVIGGLFFGHERAGIFTARSEQRLVGLAAEAAVAIDNARLAQESARELAERRRAEEALRELNATLEEQVAERTTQLHKNAEALRQAQKMEAVGQLTGGLAHDFNNLLQTIIGNIEVVRRAAADPGRVAWAANNAMNGARRAASLTQRLLAFARRQPLDPKPLEVNALVSRLSDLLHRTLGETIAIETVLGAGLWRVEADANELESAILNCAVNARDAMPEGGRLTIETANTHIDETYVASHAEVVVGQYVLLSVSDTGVGMDSAVLQQAFEPFFTTKPPGKGTGLGLSQVYGYVKQSGGHVKLYSEPGLGTTVRIYLPRLLRDSKVDEVERGPDSLPDAAPQETILVVEDDDDVRAINVDSLRELGYRVLEAADGPAALSVLRREARIDLLFTDVVLPGGMTGAQVAAQARGLRPGLRVLFTTGYARNAIVHQGRLDSGAHLLTKPFTHAELANKVRHLLDADA